MLTLISFFFFVLFSFISFIYFYHTCFFLSFGVWDPKVTNPKIGNQPQLCLLLPLTDLDY